MVARPEAIIEMRIMVAVSRLEAPMLVANSLNDKNPPHRHNKDMLQAHYDGEWQGRSFIDRISQISWFDTCGLGSLFLAKLALLLLSSRVPFRECVLYGTST